MKKDNKQYEIQMATPITISKAPHEIVFANLEINQGDCFLNSYRVAKKYPTIDIVEGLIIVVDDENGAKPMAHIWNKKGDVHFDVTKERIWIGREEMNKTKEIKYFSVKLHSSNDFKNGDILKFCSDTYENIAEITKILKGNEPIE